VNPFDYTRVTEVAEAVAAISSDASARFIAGGTNLLDLMKERVERPGRLVDITHLPLGKIEVTPSGGLRLGALATNTDVAYHAVVERRYPLLSKAILAGASAQLRNMASVGGNLLQRTRCMYFYDGAAPCNKRAPSTGCSAIEGVNRAHAILGTSEHCIATHPSDLCVALAALDAVVHVTGPGGERSIPFGELHRLPGDTPEIDTTLRRDELILAVEIPPEGFAAHHAYVKVRERASYAFALVSVAAVLRFAEGSIVEARIALGGVAHKPWRDGQVEALLHGRPATRENFWIAAEAMLRGARGFGHNDFKIELAKRGVVRALVQAAGAEVSA
jgi:xanthine dehydrogenase YagS FAD-binding subunit